MTYHKIQQLAVKFADRADNIVHKPVYLGDDEKFHLQRTRLEDFFYDFYQGVRRALNEMEGDMLALKEAKMEPSTLTVLGRVFHQLSDLIKQATPENPYLAANKLAEWLDNKHNKSIVENLNFIIDKFLSNQKSEINPGKGVKHLSIKGLKNAVKEIEKAKAYMAANPMLPDPRDAITVPPPKLLSEQTSVSAPPPANHSKETVPGIYEAIQKLKQISNL